MAAGSEFDTTVHKTHRWLNEIQERMQLESSEQAYRVLRAVLHVLRDRLTVDEAAHLGAQLPLLVRGLYYEGWDPSGKPLALRSREEFLERLESEFGRRPPSIDKTEAVRVVFEKLDEAIAEGEIEDVRQVLPKPIEVFWPELASSRRS